MKARTTEQRKISQPTAISNDLEELKTIVGDQMKLIYFRSNVCQPSTKICSMDITCFTLPKEMEACVIPITSYRMHIMLFS